MSLARGLRPVNKQPTIVFVATRFHLVTVQELIAPLAETGVRLVLRPFDSFVMAQRLERAAYVLTDFDRVHPWQAELAGKLYQALVDAGLPVLNDPRRFLPRHALIRQLHAEGVNSFTCWLPALGEVPDRFPVFLRTITAHRGPLTGLLDTTQAAQDALGLMLEAGHVLCDLVFVEYRHAPARESDGQRRKHACHRIGAHIIPGLTVTEAGWPVRHGNVNAATPEDYAADLAELDAYPYADALRRAFEIAQCEFGRADFGVVDGKVEIYEINTNPYIGFSSDHPNGDRRATDERVVRTI